MDPTVLGLAEAHGVYLPDIPLSTMQWEWLKSTIQTLPLPGELRVTDLRNMIDSVTGRHIRGIQLETGVCGWEVYTNETDMQPILIPPIEWYSAQFRTISDEDILPHFLEFNGPNSAIQYHWKSEVTFMDPPIQWTLPTVDILERSGTWIKTRFQLDENGLYRPSKVAIDLEYDSNGLSAPMARDQIGQRYRMILNPNTMTYTSANGQHIDERPNNLSEGHTVIRRGRSTDTFRNPSTVHLFTEFYEAGIQIRINPDNNLWQTKCFIPNGIAVPDYLGNLDNMEKETLDYWVNQHMAMY